MNPKLSKLQSEAKQAFRGTKLGKILTSTQSSIGKGTATPKSLMQAGAAIKTMTGGDVTRELMKQMNLGNAWAMIERYAGKDAWKQIVGGLGSVSKVLKALQDNQNKVKARAVPEEVELAINLVKAFGYGVTKPNGGVSVDPVTFAELEPSVGHKIIEQQKRAARDDRIDRRMKGLPGWNQPPKPPFGTTFVDPNGDEEPLYNMQTEMLPVSSSNVHSIGFRYDTRDVGTLLVRYLATDLFGNRQGPGSLYEYFNVPAILFERFKQAGSKGGFVWDNLRIRGTVSGHKFNYDLTGTTGEYVPRRAQLTYFRGPRGGLRATETYVPRSFSLGEIRGGRLQMRQIRSKLPEQRIGKSFAVRKGR